MVLGGSPGPGTAEAGAMRSTGQDAGDGNEQKSKKSRVGGRRALGVHRADIGG